MESITRYIYSFVLASFTPHYICETDPSLEYSDGSILCHRCKVLHCINVSPLLTNTSVILRGICVISSLGILLKKLLCLFLCVSLCTDVHISLGYKMSGIVSYWTHLGSALAHIAKCQFSKVVPVYIPTSST